MKCAFPEKDVWPRDREGEVAKRRVRKKKSLDHAEQAMARGKQQAERSGCTAEVPHQGQATKPKGGIIKKVEISRGRIADDLKLMPAGFREALRR